MTANHAHTPTREEFKSLLNQIVGAVGMNFVAHQQALDEFDRMIAQVEAAAEQRGAARALREAAEHLGNQGPLTMTHRQVHDCLNNRADRITDKEGDDE